MVLLSRFFYVSLHIPTGWDTDAVFKDNRPIVCCHRWNWPLGENTELLQLAKSPCKSPNAKQEAAIYFPHRRGSYISHLLLQHGKDNPALSVTPPQLPAGLSQPLSGQSTLQPLLRPAPSPQVGAAFSSSGASSCHWHVLLASLSFPRVVKELAGKLIEN